MTMNSRSYRIERMDGVLKPPSRAAHAAPKRAPAIDPRMEEVIASLKELKTFLDPSQRLAGEVVEAYRREITEVFKLKLEFDRMKEAIESTKKELAEIRRLEIEGQGMRRVNSELDEVVTDTEQATTAILTAAEEIEAQVRPLGAGLTDALAQKRVEIILQKVVSLYESCNFHDVTGQRIAKIVRVLKFLEDRLQRVIEAWSALDAFRGFAESSSAMPAAFAATTTLNVVPAVVKHTEAGLLLGPKASLDDGHASQAEIDAIFS